MRYKLGVLGVGVMAGGILSSLIENRDNESFIYQDIIIYDNDSSKMEKFTNLGVVPAKSAEYLIEHCEFLLLGIKPQNFMELSKSQQFVINPDYIISIMAGVKLDCLETYFNKSKGYIRLMPNMPCLIGEGTIGFCSRYCPPNIVVYVKNLFSSCGQLFVIEENKFDALTSLSGSGPAYIFYIADAMIRAGKKLGLSEEESMNLTYGTIIGSAKYAQNSLIPADELIQMVCSKGGTTTEAIKVFEDNNLDTIIIKGIEACKNRSKYLSENL